MPVSRNQLVAVAAAIVTACATPHTCPKFAILPDGPGGPVEGYAYDISANGSLVSGESRTAASATAPHGEGVRWSCTKWSGGWQVETLGFLKGTVPYSPGLAISSNGQVVVGVGNLGPAANLDAGYVWQWGSPLAVLRPLPSETFARADGCDDTGRLVVGSSANAYASSYAGTRATTWRQSPAFPAGWHVDLLDQLPGAPGESRASDLMMLSKAKRLRAVGWAQSAGATHIPSRGAVGHEAVCWELGPSGSATSRLWLGFLGDPKYSRANALSPDGRIVVGTSAIGFIPGDAQGSKGVLEHPVRWQVLPSAPSAVTYTEDLGVLPGHNTGGAHAVSDDGNVVVGQCSSMSLDASGELSIDALDCFVWDPANRMRSIRSVLDALGETRHHGWTLYDATGVSADGRWVCGNAYHDETFEFAAWVADIVAVRGSRKPITVPPETPAKPPIDIWGPILKRRG